MRKLDLPPLWLQNRHPELADLENNAVFLYQLYAPSNWLNEYLIGDFGGFKNLFYSLLIGLALGYFLGYAAIWVELSLVAAAIAAYLIWSIYYRAAEFDQGRWRLPFNQIQRIGHIKIDALAEISRATALTPREALFGLIGAQLARKKLMAKFLSLLTNIAALMALALFLLNFPTYLVIIQTACWLAGYYFFVRQKDQALVKSFTMAAELILTRKGRLNSRAVLVAANNYFVMINTGVLFGQSGFVALSSLSSLGSNPLAMWLYTLVLINFMLVWTYLHFFRNEAKIQAQLVQAEKTFAELLEYLRGENFNATSNDRVD